MRNSAMFTSQSLSPTGINPFRDLLQIYRSQVRVILTVCVINVICLSLMEMTVYFPISIAVDVTKLEVMGLLAIHAVLHLLSARVERRLRLAIIYLFVQITLLFYVQVLA